MTLFGKVEEQEIEMIKQVITEILEKNEEKDKNNNIIFSEIKNKIDTINISLEEKEAFILEINKKLDDLSYKEEVLKTNFIKMSDILVNIAQTLRLIPEEREMGDIDRLYITKDNLEKDIPVVEKSKKEELFDLLPDSSDKNLPNVLKKNGANVMKCLKCKRDVLAKNIRIEKKENTQYKIGECPICERSLARIISRE